MNWMGKSRAAAAAAAIPSTHSGSSAVAATTKHNSNGHRTSNGLKDFLWLISDIQHGRLLDLGPVCQATVSFFIERGFRLTTEDILRSWKEYMKAEDARLRRLPADEELETLTPEELANHFMESALQYGDEEFNAVLVWDIFDYLNADLVAKVSSRLYEIVHPGGAVLALFHSKPPEQFHRFRVVDHQSIEMVNAVQSSSHQRIFQNREILNLFGQFRSAKTFVGRDQIREGLFIK